MPKVLMPDGRIATFPDGVPMAEIDKVCDYLGAAAPAPTAAEPHPPARASAAPYSGSLVVVPMVSRFRVEPYRNDE